jgi:hypothetical protein
MEQPKHAVGKEINESTEFECCLSGFKTLLNTASNIHSGYYTKQITRKFKTNFDLALYILMQIAVVLNTFHIGRKFLAEH